MAGQPWAKVWVADLQTDARYKRLRAEGKAVWFQVFCEMHTEDTDRITGTIADLALALALPESQVSDGIDQIKTHDVCEVECDSHGIVTLISRRRRDELANREDARIRKQNQRKRRLKQAVEEYQSQTSHTTVRDTHARMRADSDSVSVSSGTVVETEREEEKTRAKIEKPPRPKSEPWQITMYYEATGRVPAVGYWPAITSQIARRDVWQLVLDRAEAEGWKAGNVDARVRAYHDSERTMYPKVNGKDAPKKRSVDTESDAYLKAAGLIRI